LAGFFLTTEKPSNQPLAGRCALVTGGAKRIGREIALTLARAGADVAITYRASEKEAESTAAELSECGVRSFALRCDLRDPASIRETVADAIRQLGRLDLLINNAGLYQTREFAAVSAADFDDLFAVNARAPMLTMQACAEELKRRRGSIVNIGSLGGIRPWATHAHYCASKAALHMLTEAAAKALAPEVSVNCVAPGMIDLGEPEREPMLARFAEKTPMQTNGSARDVAEAVLFFAASPQFITGQILVVDGGLSL
jgi:NAD(P)-dependent dehydrogenase (short-subunit alcohol dehydrogenase family)